MARRNKDRQYNGQKKQGQSIQWSKETQFYHYSDSE
jgi:hypothetical protein